MLINEVGVPDFWVTLFTSQALRKQTQSSINSCLVNIKHFKKWEKINDLNLILGFENSRVPDISFVESFAEHCGLKSEYIDKELQQKSGRRLSSFNQLKLGRSSALSQVSCNYQQRRMADARAFLMFVGQAILKKKSNSKALIAELNIFAKNLVVNYPKTKFSRHNKRLPHAEKEVFDKFMGIFNPESELNPFKSYDLKVRNFILVQLLFWTGARSGEILSLTLDDIDYDVNSPKVRVNRRHDDPVDSRKNQPVTKTKSRAISIPGWLRDEIDRYINKIRPQFPLSKKHPYIFVSHKGQSEGKPVSNSTFYNRVIVPVKVIDKEGFKLVKRHGFRHLFNENLSEKIDAHNERLQQQIAEAEIMKMSQKVAELKKEFINERQEIEIRMYLMGHSSEDSARPYTERHVKKKAQRIHKEIMQDMSHTMRNARGI
jgi:integrase